MVNSLVHFKIWVDIEGGYNLHIFTYIQGLHAMRALRWLSFYYLSKQWYTNLVVKL